jgi:hypothetical protein
MEWNIKFISTSLKYTYIEGEGGFFTNFEIWKYFVVSQFPGFGTYENHEKEGRKEI